MCDYKNISNEEQVKETVSYMESESASSLQQNQEKWRSEFIPPTSRREQRTGEALPEGGPLPGPEIRFLSNTQK